MNNLTKYLFCFFILTVTVCAAQTRYKSLIKDFQQISGRWHGSLTYLDYSSGKPYTMPADIEIKRLDNTNKFLFSNIYPDEMSANSTDTISISKDGKRIDEALIKSRRKLPNGDVEIVTEETGEDGNDNKVATFRHTYTLGKASFRKRKDVRFVGEQAWINRHEYAYTSKNGS